VELAAVQALPVLRAAEQTGRPEALVGMIFGSPAVAVRAGEPALEVELGLATVGARDLVRAMAPDPELAQVVELVLGSDRIVALAPGTEPERVVEPARDSGRVVELVRVEALGARQVRELNPPESSLRHWADGGLRRRY
jgi:hypothetical protein